MLDGLPVGQISAGALVAVIVLLILTGRLVTRRQLLDAQADRDKWRESADSWQQSTHTLGMAIEKVVVLSEATNHALVEIQELARRDLERPI
jgi:hypothetical protein